MRSKDEIIKDLEKIIAFSKLDEAAKDHIKLETISDYMKKHFAPEEIEGVVDWVKLIHEKNIQLYGFMSFLITSAMDATREGIEERQGLTVDYVVKNYARREKQYAFRPDIRYVLQFPEGIDKKLGEKLSDIFCAFEDQIEGSLRLVEQGWPEGERRTSGELDTGLYERVNSMVNKAVGDAFDNFISSTRGSAQDYLKLKQSLEYQRIENKARRRDYLKTAILAPALSIFSVYVHSQAFNDGNDVSLMSYVLALPIVSVATFYGIRAARYTLRRIFRPKAHQLLKEMRQPLKKYS